MNKILRCECGKLFIQQESEVECKLCVAKRIENEDPYEVAQINIMKLINSYKEVCASNKTRVINNTLLELDFVLNNAYMRGYISEEFYTEMSATLGIEPDYYNTKSLNKDDYYDYSVQARVGFYQDMFDEDQE